MFPILPNSVPDSNSISNEISSDKECKSSSSAKVNDKCCLSGSKLKFESNVSVQSTTDKQQQNLDSNSSVIAGEFLRKDLKSLEVPSEELLSYVPVKNLNLIVSYDGLLQPLENVSRNWFRNMKLSSDVYSHNASIEITNDRLVRVKISKDISIGEEISCWFSEDILMYMAIPFLIPENIRGNNCYTCHICNTSYESPNPLKIHLALLCGQQTIDILWIRLHHSLQRLTSSSSLSASSTSIGLLQNTIHPIDRNYINERLRIQSLLPPSPSSSSLHHLSAFKPVSSASTFSSCHLLSSQHQFPPSVVSASPSSSSSVSVLANAAAQIETIVSNMGTSKQGHLCIYCGKIYSRKYGLKIHIRTHTGFKPLKCKFCLRPFGDPSNLNKHVRLHLQSNKNLIYKCHFCSKILGRRRDLQRHIKTHHCEVLCDDIETAKVSSSEDD